jgi:hypothetical protein
VNCNQFCGLAMNEVDQCYQAAVDRLAADLLARSPRELVEHPEYGVLHQQIGGTSEAVGFWHYPFSDDRHHIVFKAERRVFLFLHRSYVSGVVFGRDTAPRLMTPEEAGDYD